MKVLGILAIIFLGAIVLILEVPMLVRRNYRKELGVFLVFLFLGLIFNIAVILNPRLPTPMDYPAKLFRPVTEFMTGIIKGE